MSNETDMVMFTCASKKAALEYVNTLPAESERGDEELIIILTQPR